MERYRNRRGDSEVGSNDERIRFAIANRRLVGVSYGGTMRVAEPHDYGVQNGRERLLVFQLRGPSRSGRSPTGWRLLDTGKIESLAVLDEAFAGSRGESHRGHLQWDVVYARVK
jgi:hypothetical protein